MTDLPDCIEVRDLVPELAAGVAAGEERALALAHLADCPACRHELAEASALADELIQLAPEREPELGFESRALAGPAPERRRARRRSRHPLLLTLVTRAAALGLVAAVAAAATWWWTGNDRRLAARYRQTLSVAHGRYLVAGRLGTATDPEVGHVFVYRGTPSWVMVTLAAAPQSGSYRVRVVTADHTVDVGTCQVTAGVGSYGSAVELPSAPVLRVELVKPGAPPLTAQFP